MAKVKLGSREFDVDSEVMDARGCGVTDEDCIALGERMKSGEIRKVKKLFLVRCMFFIVCFVVGSGYIF